MMPSDELVCRRLGAGDRELARQLFAMMSDTFEEPAEPLSDGYLDVLLGRPDFWIFVALGGDEVIGGVTAHALPMTRAEATELFIYDVAVRADRQRQGVGRFMLTVALAAAAEAGITVAFVPAETADAHAIDFYRALGGESTDVTMFTFEGERAAAQAAPLRQ